MRRDAGCVVTEEIAANCDAAHIIALEEGKIPPGLPQLGGINDVRNGILLCKDLHHAFDRKKVCVVVKGTGEDGPKVSDYTFHVLDLFRYAAMDGQNLKLRGDTTLWPHREYLNWHARLAFTACNRTVPEDAKLPDADASDPPAPPDGSSGSTSTKRPGDGEQEGQGNEKRQSTTGAGGVPLTAGGLRDAALDWSPDISSTMCFFDARQGRVRGDSSV